MLPHLGAGAGQGFEDVFVLAELLGHPQTTKANVTVSIFLLQCYLCPPRSDLTAWCMLLQDVLQAYDRIRRPYSQRVARGSTEAGELFESLGKPGGTVEELREKLKTLWVSVWDHDIGVDILAAVSWLEETGVFSAVRHDK